MGLGVVVAFLALAPGTASAQPIACGQTITRDTTLHADLGPCSGDGLVIGAENVTLDLNEHAIIGDNTDTQGGDVGVLDDGHGGIVVEGGRIGGFSTSIKLDSADSSQVTDITETACCLGRFGFVVSGSHNSIVRNVAHSRGFNVSGRHNTISDNATLADEMSTVLVHGSRNRITHNEINEGEGVPLGLVSVEGARNLIARNTLGDIDNGTSVVGPGNVIRNNVVGIGPSASITGGLRVADCRNDRIEENIVYNGLGLSGCRMARVEDNTVGGGAIGVGFGSDNLIEHNDVSDTEWYGITVGGGSDNAIEQNTVSATEFSGILVGPFSGTGHSVGTTVEGNLVTRAGFGGAGNQRSDGIQVDDPGTVVADNTANDNADYGIQAVPEVIDGGGNTASGNGNPLQCLNVVCNTN